ncbi:MAG: hypothetical protein ACK4WH_04410 [Phycisphaerales bacterium]
MTGTGRVLMVLATAALSVAWLTSASAYAAGDQSVDRTVARALELHEQGRHADALRELDSARALVRADRADLAAKIDYNRACVLGAMKEEVRAQEILRGLDRSAGADRRVRGSARYNLGRLEAGRAEALSTTDTETAIASLRAAERHFRNALADLPGDADTIRNVEVVQRRRAELQREQDQQKQDQQKQDQEKKPDQGRKSDQPQAGEQPQDTEGQGEKSPRGERRQSEQPRDREGKQSEKSRDEQQWQEQSPEQIRAQAGEQEGGDQPQQGSSQQDGRNKPPRSEGTDQEEQRDEGEQAKPTPRQADDGQAEERKPEQREFDVAAARILDMERIRREQIRRMLQQMMRSRAAKVEKDW